MKKNNVNEVARAIVSASESAKVNGIYFLSERPTSVDDEFDYNYTIVAKAAKMVSLSRKSCGVALSAVLENNYQLQLEEATFKELNPAIRAAKLPTMPTHILWVRDDDYILSGNLKRDWANIGANIGTKRLLEFKDSNKRNNAWRATFDLIAKHVTSFGQPTAEEVAAAAAAKEAREAKRAEQAKAAKAEQAKAAKAEQAKAAKAEQAKAAKAAAK